jgi:hypothetical protein
LEKKMKILNRTMLALALVGSMSMVLVQMVNASVLFKGTGAGEITGVQPGPTGLAMTGVAAGNATFLGKYNRSEHILIAPDGSFTGGVTFTAVNGDELTADISGGFTSGTTAAGTYTFTGGTGRFANAAGIAYFSVTLTDATHFNVGFNGSLDN